MQVFSVFLIILIIAIFVKHRKTKDQYISFLALYIFLYMNVEIGGFVGSVRYAYVLEAICLLYAVIETVKNTGRVHKHSMKNSKVYLFAAIVSTFMSVIGLLVYPLQKKIVAGDMLIDRYWNGLASLEYPAFDEKVMRNVSQYIVFLFILYSVYKSFDIDDYYLLQKKNCNYGKIIICLGCFEFVLKNIFHSSIYNSLVAAIFGKSDYATLSMEMRGSLNRLTGLTTEASHFAYVLFLITIVFYASYTIQKINIKWLILSLFLLITTMSFSSVIFAATATLIIILGRVKEKYKGTGALKIVGAIGIVSAILVILFQTGLFANSYFGARLSDLFDTIGYIFTPIDSVRSIPYSSSIVRLLSSFSTLSLVIYRPLFGIGLGVPSSHGSFSSIIAGIGIIGTTSWLFYLFKGKAFELYKPIRPVYITILVLWCAMGLLNSHFWGMLYNAENYAIMISFLIISSQGQEKNRHIRAIC